MQIPAASTGTDTPIGSTPRGLDLRLDALNFFLADVRGGLGSYVSIFLVTAAGWSPALVGDVLTASGLIGIAGLTPVGALIDWIKAKRALLVIGVALLAVCAIATERMPVVPVIFATDVVMATLGGVFAPTVAAITLGLVAASAFTKRTSRNAVFDRAGNISIAVLVGLVGWWLGQRATFYLVPLFAAVSAAVVLTIPQSAIDDDRARGFAPGQHHDKPQGFFGLLAGNRPLIFLSLFAATLHFANGATLTLVGQKLGLAHPGYETVLLSACILLAQATTIPVAIAVGAFAGRVPLKLMLTTACLAVVLRAAVFASSDNIAVTLAAQALEGVSTGIWDVLTPLLIEDYVVGSGRYSTSRGVVGTVQGIGGAVSLGVSGTLAGAYGYGTAFAAQACVAVVAGILLALLPAPEQVEANRIAGTRLSER